MSAVGAVGEEALQVARDEDARDGGVARLLEALDERGAEGRLVGAAAGGGFGVQIEPN